MRLVCTAQHMCVREILFWKCLPIMDNERILGILTKSLDDLIKSASVNNCDTIEELKNKAKQLYDEQQYDDEILKLSLDCLDRNVESVIDWLDKESIEELDGHKYRLYFIEAIIYVLAGLDQQLRMIERRNVLLSNKEEMSIKLAICQLTRVTFLPTMVEFFKDPLVMFATSRDLPNCSKNSLFEGELVVFQPVVCILAHLFCSPQMATILQQTLRENCFAIILCCKLITEQATVASVPPNLQILKSNKLCDTIQSTFGQMDQLLESPPLIQSLFRELLLIIRCGPKYSRLKSATVSLFQQSLLKPNGLLLFLDSVLNSDPTSEQVTTIQQRIDSVAKLACLGPVRLVELKPFCRQLIPAIVAQLLLNNSNSEKHSSRTIWQCGGSMLAVISEHLGSEFNSSFIEPIKSVLRGEEAKAMVTIDDCLLLLERLLNTRRLFLKLSVLFTPLFYITCKFCETISETRSSLKEILLEMLNETPKSYLILDDCIHFKLEDYATKYRLQVVSTDGRLAHKILCEASEVNYEKLADLTIELTRRMPIGFQFEFFFTVLQHLDSPSPVTLLLLEPLVEQLFGATISREQEQARESMLSGDHAVRFLTVTLERTVDRILTTEEADPSDSLWTETFGICLQIMSILVENLEKNRTKKDSDKEDTLVLLEKLKPCLNSLNILLVNPRSSELIDPFKRILAEEIYSKLKSLYQIDTPKQLDPGDPNAELLECFEQLSDPLMPVRSHALITIKQMICCNHTSIEENLEPLLSHLKKSLVDSESYIYLAAINALTALAIRHTDQVLPILFEELKVDNVQFFKVAEVIKKLSSSIGDFAHHYSATFLHKLLIGIQSKDSVLKISCLSCLGEFCSKYGNGINAYLVELLSMVEQILTDQSIEVRRAGILFLASLLNGFHQSNVHCVEKHLRTIKQLIDKASLTLDDVLHTHCALARDELNRIYQEIMSTANPPPAIRVIK